MSLLHESKQEPVFPSLLSADMTCQEKGEHMHSAPSVSAACLRRSPPSLSCATHTYLAGETP